MMASGGGAIIANLIGQNKRSDACEKLTTLYMAGLFITFILITNVLIGFDPLLKLLGTTDELYPYASSYLRIMMFFAPMMMLQIFTQTFMVAEGKPMHGLLLSLLSGIINIILDFVFMGQMNMGIAGAALATGIGMTLTALYGLAYFSFGRKNILKFKKPHLNMGFLLKAMGNGSSEMVNNLSIAFTTFLFNVTMVRLLGNEGVVAITIILYVQFIQMAIYFGFSQGISPIISYKYGANLRDELKKIIGMGMAFIGISSLFVIFMSYLLLDSIIGFFVPYGSDVFFLTREGFLIFLSAYVFMGFNVFISAVFTALGNGKVSAWLSFLRTFGLLVGCLLILPHFLGVLGVWLAVPLAEAVSSLFSFLSYRNGKERYGY